MPAPVPHKVGSVHGFVLALRTQETSGFLVSHGPLQVTSGLVVSGPTAPFSVVVEVDVLGEL